MHKLVLLSHGLVATAVVSLAYAQFNGTLFSWHPMLMSIGYLGFMSEGVIAALKFRRLESADRVRAIQFHILLQLVASVCIATAFLAIYRNKVLLGKPHFKSLHAKFGLATLSLSVAAPLGGVVAFRRFGIVTKLPEALQPAVKWAHRKLGLLTWLLSLATIQLALLHPAVYKGFLSNVWQAEVAVLGAAVLVVSVSEGAAKSAPRVASSRSISSAEDHLSKTL